MARAKKSAPEGEVVEVPALSGSIPTPQEAVQMFEDRPDLAVVVTTDGPLTRDEARRQ